MTKNKEKGTSVMCELCNLELAGIPAPAAEEEGREALAAIGSALVRNDRVARSNRDYLDLHGVTAINLISTPRAGKTSLLESTIPTLPATIGSPSLPAIWRRTMTFAGCARWACPRSR